MHSLSMVSEVKNPSDRVPPFVPKLSSMIPSFRDGVEGVQGINVPVFPLGMCRISLSLRNSLL